METESGANSDSGSSSNEVIPETKPYTRSNLLSLLVLGFSIFLAGCTISLLAPFYTKEAEDHGLSVTSSGTVFASAFVLQIVSTPIFGKYLHKIGSSRFRENLPNTDRAMPYESKPGPCRVLECRV